MDGSLTELLKRIELLASLTDEELHLISDRFIIKQVKKNEIILYEEDTNNVMYMVLSGKLKIVQTTMDGREIILAIHQSGQFFGEISLIDGKTSPAAVIAAEDSLIALVSKIDFHELLTNHSKILYNLLQIMCDRLRDSWDKLKMLTFKDPAERLKSLFLKLSLQPEEKKPGGTTLNMKLTHQDIADMTGLTRETVTRILNKWQHSGRITILENKFIQLNSGFYRET
jgi:CRP/FNR family transcriptional regulator, cyclic AMP receptor protein